MTLSLVVALVALGVAAAAVATALYQVRQAAIRVAGLRNERRRLQETVEGLSAGAVAQGERIGRVEQELQRLKERLSMLGSRESDNAAFDQAIRMARKGQPAADIAETCGLSKVEADLVVLIHQEGGDR